ncbi:HNH endonuclease signature motif containing protein [Brochothrix campestris]
MAWKKCRRGYIDSVGGLCERCLRRKKFKPGKIVHHIKYITEENIDDVYITLNWSNLEYLCQDCHNQEHHANVMVDKGLTFDKEGNLIQLSPPSN